MHRLDTKSHRLRSRRFTTSHANIPARISPLHKTTCTSYDLDTNLAQRPTIYTRLRRKYYARISSFAPVILSCRSAPPLPSGILRISSPYRSSKFSQFPYVYLYGFFFLYIYLKYFYRPFHLCPDLFFLSLS